VTDLDPRALEAAARAVWPIIASAVTGREPPPYNKILSEDRHWSEDTARAAVTAYLDALAAQEKK
jgi:hypothetical protein